MHMDYLATLTYIVYVCQTMYVNVSSCSLWLMAADNVISTITIVTWILKNSF